MAVKGMSERFVIADTCDVFLKRKRDGKVVMTTETQLASISQTVDEQSIYGGIGGGTVAVISSQKEIELTLRDALWTLDYLEMTQGVEIKEDTVNVIKDLTGTVKIDTSGDAEITLSDDSATITEVYLSYGDDQDTALPVTAGVVTISPAPANLKDGQEVFLHYTKDVTGQVVTFESDKFAEKYQIQYYTVAYDPETMAPTHDIYIIFDEAKAAGAFDMSFELSTPIAPEMTFRVTTPRGKKEMGRIIVTEVE